jgi:hypothetical protein
MCVTPAQPRSAQQPFQQNAPPLLRKGKNPTARAPRRKPPPPKPRAKTLLVRRWWPASVAAAAVVEAGATRRWAVGRGFSTPPRSSSSRRRQPRTSLPFRCAPDAVPLSFLAASLPSRCRRRLHLFPSAPDGFVSGSCRGTWTSSRRSPPSSRPRPSALRLRPSRSPPPGRLISGTHLISLGSLSVHSLFCLNCKCRFYNFVGT